MILEFLSEASAELFEAADYYESKQEGLGRRFRNEVLEVCGLIVQQPLLWCERAGGYRRVNWPVFPVRRRIFIGRFCDPRSASSRQRLLPERGNFPDTHGKRKLAIKRSDAI